MSHETTLGYLAGSDATPHLIAQYAREQARVASDATEGEAVAHVEALNAFAEFLATRPRHDQRIYAMYRLMGATGNSDTYTPGEQQARLFGMLGSSGGIPTPLPDTTLSELVAAAVDDHLAVGGEQRAAMQQERDTALCDLEISEAARIEAESASAEVQQIRDELVAARAEADDLRGQAAHLRSMLPGKVEPAEAEVGSPIVRPRRRAVEGYPGIYESERADGEIVYEIGFRIDGKQKWETIGPDFEKAVAARLAVDANAREAAAPA